MSKTNKKTCGVLLAVAALLVLSCAGCMGCVSCMNRVFRYEFTQDISNITHAEIANVTSDEEVVRKITDIEVTHTLSRETAQALAEQICLLDGYYAAPPIHRIEGLTVIFYYENGNCEMVSDMSNRYIHGDKASYDCLVFDPEEFEALVRSAAERQPIR